MKNVFSFYSYCFYLSFQNSSTERISTPERVQSVSCELCGASFTLRKNLLRHIRTKHGDASRECVKCRQTFARLDILQRHQSSGACSRPLKRKMPTDSVPANSKCPKLVQENQAEPCLGTFSVQLIHPTDDTYKDLTVFLDSCEEEVIRLVTEAVQLHRGSKYYLNVCIKMKRNVSATEEETCCPFFVSKCQITLMGENPDTQKAFNKVSFFFFFFNFENYSFQKYFR